MNAESLAAMQPELMSGESIHWAGQPDTSIVFRKEDLFLIPFSLMWGGFAIFWEMGVLGLWGSKPSHDGNSVSWFMALWGVPFIVIGQYLILGRFFVAQWKKKRMHYGVTNRRVVVVLNGWSRKMAASYLDSLPMIIKEEGRNGIGTLRFAPKISPWSSGRGNWGAWDGMEIGDVPTFADIDEVDSIYRLVSELREQAKLTRA